MEVDLQSKKNAPRDRINNSHGPFLYNARPQELSINEQVRDDRRDANTC
jgi:hypothetical protein